MKIEILGTGCPKCKAATANAEAAAAQLGVAAEIVKVQDLAEIASRGVMMTPAVAIDGEIKAVGKVPTVDEIKSWLA